MSKTNRGRRISLDELVPRNPSMTFEEVVARGHKGSSSGVDDNVELPDYIGWLLQRKKLKALVDCDQRPSPAAEWKLRSSLNLAASRKIISVDREILSPVPWGTLPQDLLFRVLAYLPLPDITRLRCLSKEWNRDMATVNSEINRAFDEASPIVVAGFQRCGYYTSEHPGSFVRICAQRLQYSYHLKPFKDCPTRFIYGDFWHDMGAVDHGLVCFVSLWKPRKASRVRIVVANLLTRVWRQLPPRNYVYLSPPQMMHIKVDPETKSYKVVVVDKNIRGRPTVEIYDSRTGKWKQASGPLKSVFGFAHTWDLHTDDWSFSSRNTTRSVYDFAERRLKRYDDGGPSRGASVIMHTHHQDCMLVLHRNTPRNDFFPVEGFYIAKYRIQNNAKDWVQERSYSLCSPLETLLEKDCHSMTLKACEDFLMVFTHPSGRCEHLWLLDLATGEWSTLPHFFNKTDLEGGREFDGGMVMTRASWNVVP